MVDVDTGVDGVMAMQEACRVAANVNIDNEPPCLLTFFLFPNPSMKEDFTLWPTAAAALTVVCSRLSASNKKESRVDGTMDSVDFL